MITTRVEVVFLDPDGIVTGRQWLGPFTLIDSTDYVVATVKIDRDGRPSLEATSPAKTALGYGDCLTSVAFERDASGGCSRELFATATATYEAALAEGRVERAKSEARVARLKYAAELERVGRLDEAAIVIAEIRAEQEDENG